MHVDDYKVCDFPTCTSIDGELRSRSERRALVHFPVRFRSIRGSTTAWANYFNPSTNTREWQYRPSPTIPGQIVFEHVPLRDQVWAPTRCMPTPQNTRCNRIASTGENNGRRPRGWIRRTCAHWRRGPRYRVRSQQIYAVKRLSPRAEHGLPPGSNISRSHSDSPFSRLVLPPDTLIFRIWAGYWSTFRRSELPRRIHRFIMLRIPSADNHVLRATRFAWNSRAVRWQENILWLIQYDAFRLYRAKVSRRTAMINLMLKLWLSYT